MKPHIVDLITPLFSATLDARELGRRYNVGRKHLWQMYTYAGLYRTLDQLAADGIVAVRVEQIDCFPDGIVEWKYYSLTSYGWIKLSNALKTVG